MNFVLTKSMLNLLSLFTLRSCKFRNFQGETFSAIVRFEFNPNRASYQSCSFRLSSATGSYDKRSIFTLSVSDLNVIKLAVLIIRQFKVAMKFYEKWSSLLETNYSFAIFIFRIIPIGIAWRYYDSF